MKYLSLKERCCQLLVQSITFLDLLHHLYWKEIGVFGVFMNRMYKRMLRFVMICSKAVIKGKEAELDS